MTDPIICSQLVLGKPQVSVAALDELRRVLESTLGSATVNRLVLKQPAEGAPVREVQTEQPPDAAVAVVHAGNTAQ